MSSVFASRHTKVVAIGEHTVTVRKLPNRHLGAAERAQQVRSIDNLKAFGGPAFIKELQGLGSEAKDAEEQKAKDEAKANPLVNFDRDTLLAKGIVEWTFPEDDGTVAPIDQAHIEDLDDAISEQLAREILQLSRPGLFDAEAETKNG